MKFSYIQISQKANQILDRFLLYEARAEIWLSFWEIWRHQNFKFDSEINWPLAEPPLSGRGGGFIGETGFFPDIFANVVFSRKKILKCRKSPKQLQSCDKLYNFKKAVVLKLLSNFPPLFMDPRTRNICILLRPCIYIWNIFLIFVFVYILKKFYEFYWDFSHFCWELFYWVIQKNSK